MVGKTTEERLAEIQRLEAEMEKARNREYAAALRAKIKDKPHKAEILERRAARFESGEDKLAPLRRSEDAVVVEVPTGTADANGH